MLNSFWAVVREGKIEPLEEVAIHDGAKVLVTLLPGDDASFWRDVSRASLDSVWDNAEDDIYGQLLKK